MKNEELEAMIKEAPGPINFTVFLTMFGEKLKGETRTQTRTLLHLYTLSVNRTHTYSNEHGFVRCVQALIPRTSLCPLSRSWTPRAQEPLRSNCEYNTYVLFLMCTLDCVNPTDELDCK